jgi:hypothetical protein
VEDGAGRRRHSASAAPARPTPVGKSAPSCCTAQRAAETARLAEPVQVVMACLVIGEPSEHASVGPWVVDPSEVRAALVVYCIQIGMPFS